MHRLALVVAAVAAATLTAACTTAQGHDNHLAEYDVSLGDSLAAGAQPDASGQGLPTNHGFTDQLYALLRRNNPGLLLQKLGCPGDTTTTMINGGICGYHDGNLVSYTADKGSQLDAAVTFLASHRGHVPLVTIAIGANDVLSCLSLETTDEINACVRQQLPIVKRQLTLIVAKLAAADPRATIAGMTYADVALGSWRDGPSGQAFAARSVAIASAFRSVLVGVYHAAGARIADVYSAFKTPDMTDRITLPGTGTGTGADTGTGAGAVPEDVGLVCEWTWVCTQPPQGPNIHPNTAGYGVIARTFQAAVAGHVR